MKGLVLPNPLVVSPHRSRTAIASPDLCGGEERILRLANEVALPTLSAAPGSVAGTCAATVSAYFSCEDRLRKRQKGHSLFFSNCSSSNQSGDRSLGVLASSSAIDFRIFSMSCRTPSLCRK
jgi:hypothetical protein